MATSSGPRTQSRHRDLRPVTTEHSLSPTSWGSCPRPHPWLELARHEGGQSHGLPCRVPGCAGLGVAPRGPSVRLRHCLQLEYQDGVLGSPAAGPGFVWLPGPTCFLPGWLQCGGEGWRFPHDLADGHVDEAENGTKGRSDSSSLLPGRRLSTHAARPWAVSQGPSIRREVRSWGGARGSNPRRCSCDTQGFVNQGCDQPHPRLGKRVCDECPCPL